MRTIELYEAEDGTRFDVYEKCVDYEIICVQLDWIMDRLPEVPDLSIGEFYTHRVGYLLDIRDDFLRFAHKVIGGSDDIFEAAISQRMHNNTFVGRIIDDSNICPLKRAWNRFRCIDMVTGREYNQPYYVNQIIDQRGEQ